MDGIWHEEEDIEQIFETKKMDLEAFFADTVMEEIRDPLTGIQLTARQHRDGDDVIEIWYFVGGTGQRRFYHSAKAVHRSSGRSWA